MFKQLDRPRAAVNKLNSVTPINKGGTGVIDELSAADAISALSKLRVNQANQAVGLDASAKISNTLLPDTVVTYPTLSGPDTIYTTQVAVFTITNFDINSVYTVSFSAGSFTRSGATINYTAPGTVQNVTLTINGRQVTFPVVQNAPVTPTITSPTTGATGIGINLSATSSAFALQTGSGTHLSTDWQLATDVNFNNIFQAHFDDTVNKTSKTFTGFVGLTTYYLRCRYKDSSLGYSAWSTPVSFTTKQYFVPDVEEAKQNPSTTNQANNVGIDSTGTRVIVASTTGAHVLVRTGTTWSLEQNISLSVPASFYSHAVNVTMDRSGTRVAIGVNTYNTRAGQVFIYIRSGSTWSQEQMITAAPSTAYRRFGFSVCFDDTATRLIVGAPGADPDQPASVGEAFIFTRSGSTWGQERTIQPTAATGSLGGFSVALDGAGLRAVIGVPNDFGGSVGAVYVWRRTGTSWAQEQKIQPSTGAGYNSGYGVCIDYNGDRLAFGVPGFNSNNGLVYVYLRSNTTWSNENSFQASDTATSWQFGVSNSMSDDGTSLMMGAFNSTQNTFASAGSVYYRTRVGTSWSFAGKVIASDNAASRYFGAAVAMSNDGSRSAVMATGNRSVYIFR